MVFGKLGKAVWCALVGGSSEEYREAARQAEARGLERFRRQALENQGVSVESETIDYSGGDYINQLDQLVADIDNEVEEDIEMDQIYGQERNARIDHKQEPTISNMATPGNVAQAMLDRLYVEHKSASDMQVSLEDTIKQRQHELADINRALAGLSDAIKSLETSIKATVGTTTIPLRPGAGGTGSSSPK